MLGLAEEQSSSWMTLQSFSDMMHPDEASSHTLLSNGSEFGVSPTKTGSHYELLRQTKF